MTRFRHATIFLALLALLPVACSSGRAAPVRPVEAPLAPAPAAATDPSRVATMSGPFQHVVLVELKDKADLAAMKADSDRLLPMIPSVRGYVSGTHVDIGRGNVARDYDIGIVVQFDSVDGYKEYLEHPIHKELIAKWRPKWRRSYMVDFAP